MEKNKEQGVMIDVEPGICGFPCRIKAWKTDNRTARFEITGTDCKMVEKFSVSLDEISVKELFIPLTRNPVFISAEKACCHNACPVPSAVVKAVEVALGLALKKDVSFLFSDAR